MIALLADALTDPGSPVYPITALALISAMIKMVWSDRTRGARVEAALRKTFADERATRELEVTAEKAAAKKDYDESLARHKDIHAREIAAYVGQLDLTKQRVSTLEAEVVELKKR